MKRIFIILSLGLSMAAAGQNSAKAIYCECGSFLNSRDSTLQVVNDTIPVIMECVLRDRASAKFYIPGYKIGEQFFFNRKMKPILKNWMVWSWKIDSSKLKNQSN